MRFTSIILLFSSAVTTFAIPLNNDKRLAAAEPGLTSNVEEGLSKPRDVLARTEESLLNVEEGLAQRRAEDDLLAKRSENGLFNVEDSLARSRAESGLLKERSEEELLTREGVSQRSAEAGLLRAEEHLAQRRSEKGLLDSNADLNQRDEKGLL
ncbi:MAG: hypothetical protein Q9165_006791 [Trypethelium subeluteriae]